jgi:hypothetical protein
MSAGRILLSSGGAVLILVVGQARLAGSTPGFVRLKAGRQRMAGEEKMKNK